jgi:hypothetical protein
MTTTVNVANVDQCVIVPGWKASGADLASAS